MVSSVSSNRKWRAGMQILLIIHYIQKYKTPLIVGELF